MKYRVKQIDNKFLPQVKKNFFSRWKTIDYCHIGYEKFYLYSSKHYALKYGSQETLELAFNIIKEHQEHTKPKKTIYHYIKK